jgi:hypothetical protein
METPLELSLVTNDPKLDSDIVDEINTLKVMHLKDLGELIEIRKGQLLYEDKKASLEYLGSKYFKKKVTQKAMKNECSEKITNKKDLE